MAETDFEILDPRFARLVKPSARIEQLHSGCAWAEGPVWIPAWRQLVWSDIPNDRMLRYDAASGAVGVFRQPSGYANGNTIDRQGRLVTCEHGNRRVTRTGHDGTITVLADRFEGKRLNSPNDVVVHPDGSVWFSDPTFGIQSDYEGHRGESEIGASYVYRLTPDGHLCAAIRDFVQPNGLAFSTDGRTLYVVESGASQVPGLTRHIRSFALGDDGALTDRGVFAVCTAGPFDGFRIDREDRLWAGAGDGVHCYTPEGELIGKILLPERVANVAFGGDRLNVLYMCATGSLYRVRLATNGHPLV